MSLDTIVAISLWMILPLGVLGSVLHFVYDWAKGHPVAAFFSAVNESYWEHSKIGVWPVAALQLVLFALGGWQYPSFIPAATLALYAVPASMIGLVFLYKSVTKRNILWVDILVFFIVLGIAQVVFVLVLDQLQATWMTIAIAAAFLAGLLVSFMRFSMQPPRDPDWFLDPITGKYGPVPPKGTVPPGGQPEGP